MVNEVDYTKLVMNLKFAIGRYRDDRWQEAEREYHVSIYKEDSILSILQSYYP